MAAVQAASSRCRYSGIHDWSFRLYFAQAFLQESGGCATGGRFMAFSKISGYGYAVMARIVCSLAHGDGKCGEHSPPGIVAN